jgi:hypothetical protein
MRGRGYLGRGGVVRALAAAVLVSLATACGSVSSPDVNGHILVVDGLGTPIRGAVIYPDYEYSSSRERQYTRDDLVELSSNAQGMINTDLDDFRWDKDGCYHFRIRRAGYEEATMSVSTDLLPPVLKVVLVPLSNPGAGPAPSASGR